MRCRVHFGRRGSSLWEVPESRERTALSTKGLKKGCFPGCKSEYSYAHYLRRNLCPTPMTSCYYPGRVDGGPTKSNERNHLCDSSKLLLQQLDFLFSCSLRWPPHPRPSVLLTFTLFPTFVRRALYCRRKRDPALLTRVTAHPAKSTGRFMRSERQFAMRGEKADGRRLPRPRVIRTGPCARPCLFWMPPAMT